MTGNCLSFESLKGIYVVLKGSQGDVDVAGSVDLSAPGSTFGFCPTIRINQQPNEFIGPAGVTQLSRENFSPFGRPMGSYSSHADVQKRMGRTNISLVIEEGRQHHFAFPKITKVEQPYWEKKSFA